MGENREDEREMMIIYSEPSRFPFCWLAILTTILLIQK
jgi:hypothetical protein